MTQQTKQINEQGVITEAMQKKILEACYRNEQGRLKIGLGNSRLDFKWDYFVNGFTRKTVKLSWVNGNEEVHERGKVVSTDEGFRLYTQGFRYSKRFIMKEGGTSSC